MKNKLIILIILGSCTGVKQNNELSHNDKTDKDFFQINIENVENRKEVKYLSHLASKVDYIHLETNEDCIINAHAKFLITDSLILVNNIFQVLKFSRDGKFLGQMCDYGRGPGENEGIASISIVPKKNIIAIQSSEKLLFYYLNGEFIKSIKTPPVTSTIFITDNLKVAYFHGGLGNEYFTFLLTNTNMDTISFVKNNLRWRDNVPSSWMSEYPYFEPFFQNMNGYYAKSIYNDTVYHISENSIFPVYHINLGKYKLPPEWRVERVMLQEPEKFEMMLEKETTCYYCNVFESENKTFMTLVNYRTHKPRYFLMERGSENGCLLTNENGEPECIQNDWDEGMDFWPEGKINDKLIYMSLKAIDLKKRLVQINTDQQNNKISNEHENFKKMIADIDISSNPILMIVTLK